MVYLLNFKLIIMSAGLGLTLLWIGVSIVLYAICSFISWNFQIDEWSTLIRSIYIVLVLVVGVYFLIEANSDLKQ